jgi:hypothetical protein
MSTNVSLEHVSSIFRVEEECKLAMLYMLSSSTVKAMATFSPQTSVDYSYYRTAWRYIPEY